MLAKLFVALIATLMAFSPCSAFAFCTSPPTPDDPPSANLFLSRPDVPLCLSGYSFSGKHSCDEWELDRYFDDVNEYISELNDYIYRSNRYAEEAIEYAKRVRLFAECEADEAKSQHK